jgi:hypothetical protein
MSFDLCSFADLVLYSNQAYIRKTAIRGPVLLYVASRFTCCMIEGADATEPRGAVKTMEQSLSFT